MQQDLVENERKPDHGDEAGGRVRSGRWIVPRSAIGRHAKGLPGLIFGRVVVCISVLAHLRESIR